MDLVGRQFGHIRVTEVVGQGGMGDVYGGYDEKLERKVALKVLNADQRLDDEARERLLREARALSRLDHRNICRIHDYIESGDVDLLVLEYIDGRTLNDVIAEKLSRSEKLRVAIAIAEVLVAAHRAGIVHRDLKPENVMLTRSGEVKVLDFGLARWLNRLRKPSDRHDVVRIPLRDSANIAATLILDDDADSRAPRSSPSGRRPFLMTEAGITLGTPLYMSPEQAKGATLTPASDMFSFGLLLQVLFTGREPHPDDLTAREVMIRVARGDTLPVEGVPRDITALIHRLKQLAPTDRPTAVETVERLRFLADKPQRIARRSAIAAIVALIVLGAWRYTVDLKAERAIAVAARAEAESRREQAEDLINFMVGDLRTKLEPVGRLDVLDDVSSKVLEYAGRLRPQNMSTSELARNAKALNQLGQVRVDQGRTPEALALFGRALTLAGEAVKREPRNGEAQLAFGATHFWIGNGLRLQGNAKEALGHMRAYMAAGDALVAIDPANREYQMERAYGHAGVGTMLEMQGDLAEALTRYQTSLAIKQELARRDPRDPDAQAEVARAFNKVGVVLYKSGRLRDSLPYHEKEVAIYRQLLSRDPKQTQWKQRLAASMAYLGRSLRDTGRSSEALTLYEQELAIESELAALDPANVNWQRNAAMTRRWIAAALLERGERATALVFYRDAQKEIERAMRLAQDMPSLAVDWASIASEYGLLLAQDGDGRGLALLRDAEKKLEPLTDRSSRFHHGRTLYWRGEALRTRDRLAAEAAWTRAENILAPLVATSADPTELALWTRVLIRRQSCASALTTLLRIRNMGYAAADLEPLWAASGCS